MNGFVKSLILWNVIIITVAVMVVIIKFFFTDDFIASVHEKQLMKKHGISVMYEGWDGRFWFYRDGKKIIINEDK